MISKKIVVLAVSILLTFCMFSSTVISQDKDIVFGREIPPFEQVFMKMFKLMVIQMDMEQLRNTSSQLSDKERAALSYYLGEEGHAKIREGLDEEKQKFLDDKYAMHTEVPSDYDFKQLYPHIFATAQNNMTMDQVMAVADEMTGEEIASQSFYLGEEGRKTLFSEMTLDRVEVILNNTEDWVLIETGNSKYKEIKDYTCILYKQERVDGELQDVEKILMKYREKPHAVYLKWLDGPYKGREILLNKKLLGKGEIRVREAGFLGVIPVTIDEKSFLAGRGTNHLASEVGLKYLMGMIETDYSLSEKRGKNEIKRVNHGMVEVDGRKVFKTESVMPKNLDDVYYCYRMYHYIDFVRSLEIKAEVYNFDNELYESYLYTQIKINQGLTDRDFDPDNPDYRL